MSALQMAQAINSCANEVRAAITDIFMLPEAVRMCSTLMDSQAVLQALGM